MKFLFTASAFSNIVIDLGKLKQNHSDFLNYSLYSRSPFEELRILSSTNRHDLNINMILYGVLKNFCRNLYTALLLIELSKNTFPSRTAVVYMTENFQNTTVYFAFRELINF